MAHPNEELLRKGYEAFQTGDMDTLRELFDPNVVWHGAGSGPLSGDFKGVDEVLGSFAKSFELSGGTLKVEIHDILANDEHAVALGTATAEREGKKLDGIYSHVNHIRDGKLVESWIHYFDQPAADEFWS